MIASARREQVLQPGPGVILWVLLGLPVKQSHYRTVQPDRRLGFPEVARGADAGGFSLLLSKAFCSYAVPEIETTIDIVMLHVSNHSPRSATFKISASLRG